MKPIREYLQELPAPYDTLALSVVDENYESYKVEVYSLANALNYMCNWQKTPQGYYFWDKVQLWCLNPNNCQLPPIPAVDDQEYIVDGVDVREHNAYLKLNPIATEPPAVEVSPEVAQPNKANELFTIIEQVRKGLIDLEQENAQLKADNNTLKLETLRANASESDLLNKVAQLESQLLSNPKDL